MSSELHLASGDAKWYRYKALQSIYGLTYFDFLDSLINLSKGTRSAILPILVLLHVEWDFLLINWGKGGSSPRKNGRNIVHCDTIHKKFVRAVNRSITVISCKSYGIYRCSYTVFHHIKVRRRCQLSSSVRQLGITCHEKSSRYL